MSEDRGLPAERADIVVRERPADEEALQRQQELFPEMLALERQRIDNERRRIDLGSRAIDARAAADERLHEYHVEKLRRQDDDRKKRRGFGMRLVWVLLAIGVGYVGLSLYFLFAGDETQREAALYLLLGASALAGGYGLLTAIARGFDNLFGR